MPALWEFPATVTPSLVRFCGCRVTVRTHAQMYTKRVAYELKGIRAETERDGTRAETRFGFPAKRTSPLYRRGCQFSRLLTAEVCASAVVMLDRPCLIQCKTAGYPLHSPFSPSLLHPCVSVCHHIQFPLLRTIVCIPFTVAILWSCS